MVSFCKKIFLIHKKGIDIKLCLCYYNQDAAQLGLSLRFAAPKLASNDK